MHTRAVPSPTRDEIEQTLLGLLQGSVTRTAASTWAVSLFDAATDPPPWGEATESALSDLAVADALDEPGRPLYGAEDFAAWLHEFRVAWPKPD